MSWNCQARNCGQENLDADFYCVACGARRRVRLLLVGDDRKTWATDQMFSIDRSVYKELTDEYIYVANIPQHSYDVFRNGTGKWCLKMNPQSLTGVLLNGTRCELNREYELKDGDYIALTSKEVPDSGSNVEKAGIRVKFYFL